MVSSIVKKVIENLNNKVELSEVEKEKISYSLTAIFNDLSKLLILLIIFSFLGLFYNFLMISIFSIALRVTIGGFHFRKYWSCLLFTFAYYLIIISINKFILNDMILIIIYIVAAFCIIWLAPMTSLERAAIRKTSIGTYKFIAFMILSLYFLIYIIKKDSISQLSLLTSIAQSIQLLIMKGVNIYETYNKNIITKHL